MHNAPSVSYPVGRCAFQRQLYLFLLLATLAVLSAWALNQGVTRVWCAAALLAMVGGVLGAFSLRFFATLSWSGQRWCLHDQSGKKPDELGEVEVILDTQKTLLLRWQPTSDKLPTSFVWLWLGAELSSSRWQELRCAVYQRKALN
jgi:toxin CptA